MKLPTSKIVFIALITELGNATLYWNGFEYLGLDSGDKCHHKDVLSCLPSVIVFTFCFLSRLLVSASQDGKLIIWDSYTTNKVRLTDMLLCNSAVNRKEGNVTCHDFGCITFIVRRPNFEFSKTIKFLFKEYSSVLSALCMEMCTTNGKQLNT